MGDLRSLAEQFIKLTEEIEAVRSAMLQTLTNGAAGEPRPFSPAARPRLGTSSEKEVTQARPRIIEFWSFRGQAFGRRRRFRGR